MAAYDTILEYLNCSTGVKDEIERIDAIISALMDSMLNSALKADVEEYRLDDGQTVIKAINSDPARITKAIEALERRKNYIINNNCLGRVIKLRDKDSFLISK